MRTEFDRLRQVDTHVGSILRTRRLRAGIDEVAMSGEVAGWGVSTVQQIEAMPIVHATTVVIWNDALRRIQERRGARP